MVPFSHRAPLRQTIGWPLVGLAVLLTGCHLESPTSPLVILSPTGVGVPATGGADSDAAPIDPNGGETAVRPLAERNATKQGVPTGLVMAVISQESNFRPSAVSPVGAQGLMQLMPLTVQHINQVGAVQVLDPFNAEQNVAGGTWYLKWVRSQVPTDKVVAGEEWNFTLGGYNAGIGRVRAEIDKALAGAPRNPRVSWQDIADQLPGETQRYVPAVVAKWEKYGK